MQPKKTVIQWIAAILNGIVVLVLLVSLAACTLRRGAAELQNTDHPTLWGYGLESDEDGSLILVHPLQQYALRDEVLYVKDGALCRGWVMLRTDTTVSVGNAGFTMVRDTDIPLSQVVGRCEASWQPFGLPLGSWMQLGFTNKGLLFLVTAGVLFAELPVFLRPRAFCELERPEEEEN